MLQKKIKKTNVTRKKKVELPSFLLDLKTVPEEIELPLKPAKSKVYLGPIFFGVCKGYHPPLHSLKLVKVNLVRHVPPSRENFLDDILLPKKPLEKYQNKPQAFKVFIPRKEKTYYDPFPHKCPGFRRVFKPEIKSKVIDFGENSIILQGETSQEVQFCRLKSTCSSTSENNVEMVTLSDVREKNRIYMSAEERAAHAHFPKELTMVSMHGPKIPASIKITGIPSKRRKSTDYKSKVISKIWEKKEKEEGE